MMVMDERRKNSETASRAEGQTSVAGVLSINREKPHNLEAESAILGAMLMDSEAVSTAMGRLNFEGAFYSQAHQTIFNAMVALNANSTSKGGVDAVVLADYLEKNGQLQQVGGQSYLLLLMDKVPTAAFIDRHVDIVRQAAVLRKIIATCTETILQCYEHQGKAEELLDVIEKQVLEVSQMNERRDYLAIAPLVDNAMKYIVKLISATSTGESLGIATGYDVLDKSMTGGLQPGMLFVLAARPSIGKTALALNMAYNMAMNGVSVGIFSLEMSADQLTLRLISSGARVNISNLAYQTEQMAGETQRIKETCSSLKNARIVIDETGGIDILELRSKARRMVEKNKVQVLFIDYLQLITISSTNRNASRENDVARISGALKSLAKELNIPIVVLAQVNRAAEQGDGQPKLSNLRESGAIEQDADVVALLHRNRDEQYAQGTDQSSGLDAVLIIAKNRNGMTGKQNLTFFPYYTRFDPREETVSAEDVQAMRKNG
ncbi:MAG: replicative DNA helicase [Oligosphaeraceae bacterium]